MAYARPPVASSTGALSPLSLRVDEVGAMLNFELAEHPVYDGGELQWFDDEAHGTGMLAFLSRRGSRRVDYYAQPGLRLDRGGYEIGGGTGAWTETDFDAARLVVADDGVDAEARFTDVDGRLVEVRVDDRDGKPRRPGGLLAPVSAGIDRPVSLLLVWLPRFDLVRATGAPPVIRIDGVAASTGRLPGMRLHRRHLVKYAAPVVTVEVNRSRGEVVVPVVASDQPTAESDGHRAVLRFVPPFPDLRTVPDGTPRSGRWQVEVDGTRLTGGAWSVARAGSDVDIALEVDERWKPGRLPWLMQLVTTVVPVFRRWPTTYRWQAHVRLGDPPTMAGRWERTGHDRGRSYRRATGA